MISNLKVTGEREPQAADPSRLIFSWESERERQFTIEMASDPLFHQTVLYADTHNGYYQYDGFPLRAKKTYYWRVRSGVGPWAQSSFCTAEHSPA